MDQTNVANFPASDEDSDNTTSQSSAPKDVGGVAGARLKAFIERIERLEEEKKAIADDIKDIYGEAKAVGYDAKILRKIVSLRKMDTEKRREEEELLELYKSAIGLA